MSTSPRIRMRRRLAVIGSAFALGAGGSVVVANFAGAASGPSVLDYAQCQNGAPGTTPSPDCTWINGILNASGSQYHEDQVTAQRLTIQFPDKGAGDHNHSVTLSYLDRKGTIHAYDSLAQVDATMADADDLRCLGIASICPGGSVSMTDITHDGHSVGPVADSASKVVSTHELTGQKLMIWGATFPATGAMTEPSHNNNATDSGDDYATTTINFVTNGNGNHNVQLLFGGHLAAGLTIADNGSPRGWGTGLGAGDVSGGPYHIKLAAVDGASAGNRDNQIMSNAIIKIIPQGSTLETTPSVTSATVGASSLSSVTDHVDMTPASGHEPTGTITFTLYGPLTAPDYNDCTDPDTGITGNVITGTPITGVGLTQKSGSTTVWEATSTPGLNMTGLAPGVYQWVADYVHGSDPYNTDEDGLCGDSGERVTISRANPTGTSTQTVTDTVTLSNGSSPTGHLSWYLYPSLTDCQNDTNRTAADIYQSPTGLDTDANNALSSGSATSKPITPTPAAGGTTYYWKVTYDGDSNNNGGTVEACGTQTVTIQNAPV